MKKNLFLFLSLLLLASGCQNQLVKESSFRRAASEADTSARRKTVSLVTWNLQTFFDAVTNGSEYKDFKNSERWTKEKYLKRLDKLCDIMTSLDPDLFVMEEIESEAVVQDIANRLAGGSWSNKKNWQYVCFAKESGSAIGCAVFSKYELTDLRTHSLDIRCQKENQPSSRPLMQVTVCLENQEMELIVNHWKSKSGGEEESEIWRDWQELVLSDAASAVTQPLLICGDFNRSAEDFILQNKNEKKGGNTILRGSGQLLEVYSPWFRPDGKASVENGSYYYNGEWERIDNIFVWGNLEVNSFTPVADPPLADEEGIPSSYKLYTGEGYSDHLPLKCLLSVCG